MEQPGPMHVQCDDVENGDRQQSGGTDMAEGTDCHVMLYIKRPLQAARFQETYID